MEIAIGILAFSNLVLAILAGLTFFKVQKVQEATNGLSQKLQDMAEQRGFEAGHQEAEDEAALRKEL